MGARCSCGKYYIMILSVQCVVIDGIFPHRSHSATVHLTSIDHPQIEGKFTATPDGLTSLFNGCKD
jgi:hypothetical protein